MKCAKEVMEQSEISTNELNKKNLCEVVKTITEDLFSQASAGYSEPPKKYIYIRPITGGRDNAIEIEVYSNDRRFRQVVFWHDFVTVMESLCYKITKNSTSSYIITPNPSC